MQAGSELSGGLGTPSPWNPPEHATHPISGMKVRERRTKLPSPKGKTRSWCAKRGEELMKASTMMTAGPWDDRR